MTEFSEQEEKTMNDENIAAEAALETETVEAPVEAEVEEATEEVADAEETKIDPTEIDDQLFDKINRAARLMRGRRDMMREEAEEDAKRLNDLMRALKLLELKPRMEQKEMAELLGMRLLELIAIMIVAE